MQVPLYANDEGSSLRNSQNPSLCAENRLNLLPEHIAQIGSAFILQLSIITLRPQDSRILSAIYSQTIGYNKREDDMNGTRLEQLTGIRSDHANEAVRRLQTANVIITHRGRYGKWMSINFDFAHWGEKLSECYTNDPSCLLSNSYPCILLDDELEFRVHSLPNATKVAPVAEIEKTVVDIPMGITIEKNQQQTAPPPVITNLVQTSPKPSTNPSEPSTKPSEPSTKPSKPSKPSPSFEFHFPDSMSEKLRNGILNQLKKIKIPQQAQRLLDYFVKRLAESNIRNPIAYFTALKNRLLKGQLDLPEEGAVVEEKKKVNTELNELRSEYQEAFSDREQLKKHIQLTMNSEKCTFDKAIRKICYHELWKTACKRLDKIIKTLKIYHKEAAKLESQP